MLNQSLSIVDLKIPSNFPIAPYEAIYNRVLAKFTDNLASEQFSSSWEHSQEYSRVINQFDITSPDYETFYSLHRELFHFFVSSLSTIESFCYGLYFIGSLVDSTIFKTQSDNLKDVTLKVTVEKYAKYYRSIHLSPFPSGSIIDELIKVTGFQSPTPNPASKYLNFVQSSGSMLPKERDLRNCGG